MKILISGLNFAPELTGIGKYTAEMAQWLTGRGHEVRVVSAPPYYPDWKVWAGYSAKSFVIEEWNGIRILRCPIWVPRHANGLKRVLHLLSFAASNFVGVLRQAPWRPDIIWVVEPALFTAPTAVLFSKLTGAKCWLHVQDFEVDAAFEMGLIRGRALRRTVSAAERFLLRQFSCVSTISYKMLALAERKGVDRRRLALFRNWVDVGHIVPRDGVNRFRTSLRIAADQVVALYSGNMGAKQGLEVLADAARDLQEDKRIMFVFCGDGVGRADLASRCSGLPNVIMIPLQPKEDLPELLSMADIHLLPQRADAADLVLPSKLTGMLASGRPVVATAQSDTELGSLIETAQCGLLAPPGDSRALVSAIQMLAADATRRTAMGRAGRNYAENHLSMDSVLREFEHKLEVLRQAGEALSPAMPTGDAMNERGRH